MDTPRAHKSVWMWLVVIIILASIGLIAYQQGFLNSTPTTKSLTPDEAKKINDFLTQTEVPPISDKEAAAIGAYLQTEPVKPLNADEKKKILDYLNQ
jgi:hypothetical protein